MRIRIGVLGFLLGMAALTVSPSRVYGQEKVHIVQKGETFYSISRTLGIKVDDLMKFNGITDPAKLQAGQRLKIPGAAAEVRPPVPASSPGKTAAGSVTGYRAVKGDTFFGIARKFSVTVEALRKANSLSENYMLREGDSLRIPVEVAAETPPKRPAPAETVSRAAVEPRETETRTVDASVRWPVAARELSYMTGKLSGVVIAGLKDESVKSLTFGSVLSAGPFQGFGRVVIIQVEGGYLYVYGGCESLSVKEGDKVGPGTELGKLGIDAVSNKPQLFFMVYRSNNPIDPAKAPRA
jgi:murein DD-endopeptidase MepM/ murein hydrolase activator NlpD